MRRDVIEPLPSRAGAPAALRSLGDNRGRTTPPSPYGRSRRRLRMAKKKRPPKGDFARGERTTPPPDEAPDFARGEQKTDD